MELFLQQVVLGLSIASVIALIAIGITMIFGLTGIVNFAQGEMLMIGGYVVWFVIVEVGLGGGFGWYLLGLVLAIAIVGGLGLVLERGLFRFTLQGANQRVHCLDRADLHPAARRCGHLEFPMRSTSRGRSTPSGMWAMSGCSPPVCS